MPDIGLAARHYGLANLSFQQIDVGDRRPARAGDEDAVGFGRLLVEPLGDLVGVV